MRPKNLITKIFLDGGDPAETRGTLDALGFLDGQTTNPTLISKNPEARLRLEKGERFTPQEVIDFYKKVVAEISALIPEGSVSIEVYADAGTPAENMLAQAREMFSWIPNAHIKFPTNAAGLEAAEHAVREGMRVNMTLCFSQEQAAAVHAATRGAKQGDVLVSPFIGRLDDRGENGIDLVQNIIRMYREENSHVLVLAASIRTSEHLFASLDAKADIITAPFEILRQWAERGTPRPNPEFTYQPENLSPIPYRVFDLSRRWPDFDIRHDLTDKGIQRFADDWNTFLE